MKLDGLNHMSYEHRLNTLCAESLELRRLKLDLTMMYKISLLLLPLMTVSLVLRSIAKQEVNL